MDPESNTGTNKYAQHEKDRKSHTDAVLNSGAERRIVIAGPGTGKSFLFQSICEKNIKNGKTKNLTLSFINELVDDLSRDLEGLSDVKTLHSFALSLISGDPKMFLNLGEVIEEDYKLAEDKDIDFNNIFCNLIEDKGLSFYSERRKYYNFFSPNCSVYTLLKIFEKDPKKIPKFSQILVDEFQDFNKLESSLLDYLATSSPILIAGDDDQSLYTFKHANPGDIRSKHVSGKFESFQLPFCSRCTEVTIKAFNRILEKAKSSGLLSSRLAKRYEYFPTEEKDKVSSSNPKLIFKQGVFHTALAFNIETEIRKIFNPRSKQLPSVIIICSLKSQIANLEIALRGRGFKNIDAAQKFEKSKMQSGFELLLDDSKSNLGWRIVSGKMFEDQGREGEFKVILKSSIGNAKPFYDLLKIEDRTSIKEILATLRKIRDNEEASNEEKTKVFDFLQLNPIDVTATKIKDDFNKSGIPRSILKDVPIKITTILGSKGLTKDYAFLVNFDDRYLLDKKEGKLIITDGGVCKFLVALTRAKIKTFIYTGENKIPTFVKWIGGDLYI